MAQISRHDIKGPAIYEGMRDDFRKKIMELKQSRRVFAGERVFITFENRHTLLMQIEEMLRAESITDEAGIQAEIDVYNELMPTDTSLSATLFLAIPQDLEGEAKKAEMKRLIGIDEHVSLVIGEQQVRAAFEPGRSTDERISAVQYMRFPLTPAAKEALRAPGTPLVLVIDHPNYQQRVELSEDVRASLAADVDA